MALLTIPSVTKGVAASVSLNKTDLFTLAAVAADEYFSDQTNVKRCIIELNSHPGNQRKILQFDLSQANPTASLLISLTGRDSFLLERLVLEDFDGGLIILERSQLPSGLGVTISNSGGSGGGGGEEPAVLTLTSLINQVEEGSPGVSAAVISGGIEPYSIGIVSGGSADIMGNTLTISPYYGVSSFSVEVRDSSDPYQTALFDVAVMPVDGGGDNGGNTGNDPLTVSYINAYPFVNSFDQPVATITGGSAPYSADLVFGGSAYVSSNQILYSGDGFSTTGGGEILDSNSNSVPFTFTVYEQVAIQTQTSTIPANSSAAIVANVSGGSGANDLVWNVSLLSAPAGVSVYLEGTDIMFNTGSETGFVELKVEDPMNPLNFATVYFDVV